MSQNTLRTMTICLAAIASASLAAATEPGANQATRDAVAVETTNLQPFTNTAAIPAGADTSSIRFESAKAVEVATRRSFTTDGGYCEEGGYREPGGSAFCPSSRDESPMPAYRITYSYTGPAMASDEYGNTRFTFSVYVPPDQLNPTASQEITSHKFGRTDAADFFRLSASRGSVEQVAIDEANSTFCAGNYIDGEWSQTDPSCQDKVAYKTVTAPSSYITVRVVPSRSAGQDVSAE